MDIIRNNYLSNNMPTIELLQQLKQYVLIAFAGITEKDREELVLPKPKKILYSQVRKVTSI